MERRSTETGDDGKGFPITLTATRGECRGTSHWIDFSWDNPEVTFADILEVFGELPIPHI